jgi:hypothetical protein
MICDPLHIELGRLAVIVVAETAGDRRVRCATCFR